MTQIKRLRLEIELVPQTCWYKNLRNQMKTSDWDKLRRKVYADQGYVCCVCSARGQLHCHEMWHYDDQANLQTLKGFEAVCRMCHHVDHFGLAQVLAAQGKLELEQVIQHFMRVNQATREEFLAHKKEAFDLWRKRSQHAWQLELGEWSSLVTTKSPQGPNTEL